MSVRDILEAIEIGNADRLSHLLEKCPDDLKSELRSTVSWSDVTSSPLHSAVYADRREQVYLLVEFGSKCSSYLPRHCLALPF